MKSDKPYMLQTTILKVIGHCGIIDHCCSLSNGHSSDVFQWFESIVGIDFMTIMAVFVFGSKLTETLVTLLIASFKGQWYRHLRAKLAKLPDPLNLV